MARHETDREDLLREATALVERVEFELIDHPLGDLITAGFRPDGAASLFFGADPVYQFNAAGELRRAFCDGLLYKANQGRLVSLRRIRQQHEVQLLRHELTDAEHNEFIARMQNLLAGLATALTLGEYKITGQVPSDVDVVGRLREWLSQQHGTEIADAPHAQRRDK